MQYKILFLREVILRAVSSRNIFGFNNITFEAIVGPIITLRLDELSRTLHLQRFGTKN